MKWLDDIRFKKFTAALEKDKDMMALLELAFQAGAEAAQEQLKQEQGEPVTVVEKVISNLEPLIDAKNQSWAQAEKMLLDILGEKSALAKQSTPCVEQENEPDQKSAEELNCAEDVLDALSVGLDMGKTDFECIGEYITAVFEAQAKKFGMSKQKQDEPVAYPDKCPITRRDFFMLIEHPTLGLVPTYGGPYDSYTIPHMEGDAGQLWHERELICHRFDHDEGYWMDDVMGVETIPMRVISEDALNELLEQKEDTTPQQQNPLEGVIDVKPIGYHSLQLIFDSQESIKKFQASYGIKGDA